MKRFLVKGLVIALGCLLIYTPLVAEAVSGDYWQAGRIIDDAVFTDKDAMTPLQIQQFLDSMMPACDTHGVGTITYPYNGQTVTTSRALYSYRKGNGAVTVIKPDNIPDSDNSWYTDNTWFRCLNAFWENPSTGQNNYANRPTPAGGQSAAQLIWLAAQNNNISPKTLLVTLQKEQGLLTDTWPFQIQYLHAMGAYCPDTAPCDPNHEGFSKQMNDGAALFRYYLDNMYQPWWSYKKPGNNNILYNPNTNCGASTVYIQNMTTAALYTYTPYQPNGAALNNLYGTGDGCSAYGNRNFWRNFSDWFGTTYTDGYVAQFNAQSASTEPYYPGEPRTAYIQYKNMGSARWYDDVSVPAGISPVHLAAVNPPNHQSVFSAGWPSAGRSNFTFSKVYEANGATLAANQHTVEPGQIARFEFNITPPWNIDLGVHREYFQPVLEGASNWSMGGQAWLDITVDTRYKANFYNQSSTSVIKQNNDIVNSFFAYKNTGSAAWYDDISVPGGYNPTHLATSAAINRWSGFGANWPTRSRPSNAFSKVYEADGTTLATNQHVVMPGQIGRFDFQMSAPATVPIGSYREYFQPIIEGSYHPLMGGVSWYDINVTPMGIAAQFNLQSAFPSLNKGQGKPVFLQYKNNGSARWYDNTSATIGFSPVHLAASNPINRQSTFSYGWPSNGRPNLTFTKVLEADGTTLAANQHIVEPGQIGRFDFNLTAPWTTNTGTYREFFQPVVEGAPNWNIGALSWQDVTVN